MHRIEVRGLTKRYRRAGGSVITPVNRIDLTVEQHEMVVLLGPSGCGKTTLLRCVAGLERPDEGEIVIDGELVFSGARQLFVPPDKRKISMIFQSFALWPHMTIFDNVAYPLQNRGLSGATLRDRVTDVLKLVGIGGLEAQHPGRISGGQQQRVALARALVSNSSVVLFDEPLSNVDAQVRAQLRFELKRMQTRIGFSGLYVTHDQTEAMELGHRVAVLENGRIAALGTPRDVYDRPASEYVAHFVGVANVLAGRIVKVDGGRAEVDTALGPLQMAEVAPGSRAGDEVKLVIRPERWHMSLDAPTDRTNALQAKVEGRLFSGPHIEYVLSRGEQMLRVWSQAELEVDEGAEVWLSCQPNAVRMIPAGLGVPA